MSDAQKFINDFEKIATFTFFISLEKIFIKFFIIEIFIKRRDRLRRLININKFFVFIINASAVHIDSIVLILFKKF